MKAPAHRWLIAAGVGLTLAGLVVWQQYRLRLVAACVAADGIWIGAASRCLPAPGSPILQRDLRRS